MSPQKRRNIFGFLLITLLILPTLSTILWLNYQKKQVKREVKNEIMTNLSDEDLVELSFEVKDAIKELKWEKKHEFEYKGKMYDIVRKQINGTQVTFWCWLDKEETALNAKLDNLLQIALSGNQSRKSKEHQLETFLKTMTFQSTLISSNKIDSKNNFNIHYVEFFDNIYPNVSSPPPEII